MSLRDNQLSCQKALALSSRRDNHHPRRDRQNDHPDCRRLPIQIVALQWDFQPAAARLSACGAGGVGQEGDCALAAVARIVARAAPPMAHFNVFVVSFICFVRGAMLKRRTRKNT